MHEEEIIINISAIVLNVKIMEIRDGTTSFILCSF